MIDIASIVIPRGYTLVRVSAQDDAVLRAMEATWAKIREQDSKIPAAVFDLTPGRETACGSVGWDQRPPVLDFNLIRDGRTMTGAEMLERLLHHAGHAVIFEPGQVSATRGRYHTAAYRDAAIKLGLDVEPDRPERGAGDGFSKTSLAHGTLTGYRSEVGKLDRALSNWAPTGTPKTERTDKGNAKLAVCSCDPARKIRVWPGVLSKGVIRCEICGQPFTIPST